MKKNTEQRGSILIPSYVDRTLIPATVDLNNYSQVKKWLESAIIIPQPEIVLTKTGLTIMFQFKPEEAQKFMHQLVKQCLIERMKPCGKHAPKKRKRK